MSSTGSANETQSVKIDYSKLLAKRRTAVRTSKRIDRDLLECDFSNLTIGAPTPYGPAQRLDYQYKDPVSGEVGKLYIKFPLEDAIDDDGKPVLNENGQPVKLPIFNGMFYYSDGEKFVTEIKDSAGNVTGTTKPKKQYSWKIQFDENNPLHVKVSVKLHELYMKMAELLAEANRASGNKILKNGLNRKKPFAVFKHFLNFPPIPYDEDNEDNEGAPDTSKAPNWKVKVPHWTSDDKTKVRANIYGIDGKFENKWQELSGFDITADPVICVDAVSVVTNDKAFPSVVLTEMAIVNLEKVENAPENDRVMKAAPKQFQAAQRSRIDEARALARKKIEARSKPPAGEAAALAAQMAAKSLETSAAPAPAPTEPQDPDHGVDPEDVTAYDQQDVEPKPTPVAAAVPPKPNPKMPAKMAGAAKKMSLPKPPQ